MRQIKLEEGKVVAPQGKKVGIVAARFNEIIVNKLLGGAVDGLVRHGVEEENITAAWVPGAFEIPLLGLPQFHRLSRCNSPPLVAYVATNSLSACFRILMAALISL